MHYIVILFSGQTRSCYLWFPQRYTSLFTENGIANNEKGKKYTNQTIYRISRSDITQTT